MNNQEAIASLKNIVEYWTYKPTEVEAAKLAITALEAQQADVWIPVTKKLPEIDNLRCRELRVFLKDATYKNCYYATVFNPVKPENVFFYYKDVGVKEIIPTQEIIAWHELPLYCKEEQS